MIGDELILAHETRRLIYNHIQAHPGVSYTVLREVYDLKDGTLRYHLDLLTRAGKICCPGQEGKRSYFPSDGRALVQQLTADGLETQRLNSAQQKILSCIRRYPAISQKDLARRAGVSRYAVYHATNKLLDLGLIRRLEHERSICYECMNTPLLNYEILKRLMVKLLRGEIDEQTFNELKEKLVEGY